MLRQRDRHVDDDTLLAFQLDQLEQRRVLDVATHLQECDSCIDRLDALNSGLEAAGELTGESGEAAQPDELDSAPARRRGLRLGVAGLGLLVGGAAMGLLYYVSPGAAPSVGIVALASVVTLALVLISVGSAQRLLTGGERVFRRRYMAGAPPARPNAGPGWTRSVLLGLAVLALLLLAYLFVLGPRAEPMSPAQFEVKTKHVQQGRSSPQARPTDGELDRLATLFGPDSTICSDPEDALRTLLGPLEGAEQTR